MSEDNSPSADDLARRINMLRGQAVADTSRPQIANPVLSGMRNVAGGAKMLGGYAADAVGEMWSGNQRMTGDYPEMDMFSVGFKNAAPAFFARAFAADPLGYANIMTNMLPGSSLRIDNKGNPLIEWQGKTYYANRPGASGADLGRLAIDMVTFAPAGYWAIAAKTALRAAGKGAAGSAMTDLFQQFMAQGMGSGQPIDLARTGVAAVGGGLSEPVARMMTPVVRDAWLDLGRRMNFGPNWRIADRNGVPTPLGRQVADSAFVGTGLSSADLTPGDWAALDYTYASLGAQQRAQLQAATGGGTRMVPQADPAMSLVQGSLSNARLSAGGIPMTAGQQSRDQELLLAEQFARSYRTQNPEVARRFQTFDTNQNEAILANIERLRGMASGRGAPTDDATASMGSRVQHEMNSARAYDEAYVAAAYDNAADARLDADPVLRLPRQLIATLRARNHYVTDTGFRDLRKQSAEFLDYITQETNRIAKMSPSRRARGVRLQEIEEWRQILNQKMRQTDPDGPDFAALSIMKGKFDNEREKIFNRGWIDGDPEALSQIKEATAIYRNLKSMWEPTDGVNAGVARTFKKIRDEQLDNNEIINWVFGQAASGISNGNLQLLRSIRNAVGVDSPAWGSLREAAVTRILLGPAGSPVRQAMTSTSEKTLANTTGTLLKNLDNALDLDGRQIMEELFTPSELRELRLFRRDLRQIQPGKHAPLTTTGASLGIWLERLGGFIGSLGGAALGQPGVGYLVGQQMSRRANQAVTNRQQVGKTIQALTGWQAPPVRSFPVWTGLGVTTTTGAYNAARQMPEEEN